MIRSTLKRLRDLGFAKLDLRLLSIESRLSSIEAATETRADLQPMIMPISEKEVVARLFNGMKIYLDPRDLAVAPHIALEAIWEDSVTKAWNRVLEEKKVVFDVGANFGYFGLLALNKLNKKSGTKIVFFEPNPNLLPYIDKSLSVNWLHESAVIENLGVSDKSGKARLTILKDYIGCSSLQDVEGLRSYLGYKMDVTESEVVEVDTLSIDEYIKMSKLVPDLIKIDIEGLEDSAYKGMSQLVKKSDTLTVFMEFTKDAYGKPKDFFDKMVEDFDHLYLINSDGELTIPANRSYKNVILSGADWTMLVLSKTKLQ